MVFALYGGKKAASVGLLFKISNSCRRGERRKREKGGEEGRGDGRGEERIWNGVEQKEMEQNRMEQSRIMELKGTFEVF